ncbi:MAG: hypothetical protein LBR06_07155 [Bacteroidales bacterium]|nr:hypothetical protein [Bacteroidales bacterium]
MKYLPNSFEGYRVDELLDYEGEALFDYINGGAELFMSYGLKGMTGCKYSGDDLPQITVEVYEMTSAANAFGVYTQSRDRDEHDYGQGSQSFDDFILFWKDRYYIIITTHKATPESARAMKHFATRLDRAIEKNGAIPAIISALPKKGLADGGYLYFHHYVWLNAYLFIADYNIINITDKTDAVLAKYGEADARAYLLMADYPAEADAMQAFNRLREKFAPEKPEDTRPLLQLEDGKWFSAWQQGRRLCAVFNGATAEQVENLHKVINNLKQK